jgi:Domain of unknown function (DUF4037)
VNGLQLAEAYYRDVGAPMIGGRFGAYVDRIAVGLAGPGSECLGFDDEVSRDHDWGPAFCLWLTDADFDAIGAELQSAYVHLPATYGGYGPRLASPGEEWRVGVSRAATFFMRFTGLSQAPMGISEWLRIPEHSLASCTNGKVFRDGLGEFTRWREALLDFYPEDVRLSKIASLCITIAQSGQYNYARSIRRQEAFSAAYSMVRFCSDAMQLVFLLNRRFAPFYKWLHRAVGELPLLGPAVQAHVAVLLDDRSMETRAAMMEEIAALLATEIRRQDLSDSASDFLLDHAPLVQERISDPVLRSRLSAAS